MCYESVVMSALAVVLPAASAALGGLLGWLLPSLAHRLVGRWGLVGPPQAHPEEADWSVDALAPPAANADPASGAMEGKAAGPPLWHRVGLALALSAAGVVAAGALSLHWRLPLVVVALAWLALVAAIDLQTHLIPNRLTYPALVLSPLAAALVPDPAAHLLGGLIAAGCFGLAYLVNRRGLGLGDVKLALVIGLYLGLERALVAVVATLLLGGLAALAALVAGRSRKSAIPYGPMLAAGGAIALLQ